MENAPPFRRTLDPSMMRGGTPGVLLRRILGVAALVAVGVFLARAPLSLSVILVCGAVGIFLVARRPEVTLYGLAFSVPFGSLLQWSVGGLAVGTTELLLLALVGAWLLRALAFRRFHLAWSPLMLALLVYLAALVVALLPVQALGPAVKEVVKWAEVLTVALLVAGETDRSVQRRLVAALLIAGALQGALGIYQFLTHTGPPAFELYGRYMRAHGSFLQPNPYGGYLGLLLPLAYVMVLTQGDEALRGWRAGKAAPGLLWLISLVAGAIMSVALLMSWSRGALMGLAVGGGLVALAMGRRAWLLLGLIALVLALGGPGLLDSLPGGFVARIAEVGEYAGQDLTAVEVDDANFAVVERVAHWVAAWRMFEQNPWLGVGTGQYATVYASVALPRWQDPLGHAHNYYLHVLAETGLVGLVSYLTLMVGALLVSWRRAHRTNGWARAIALSAIGMLGHLAAHSAFDNLYVHGMYLVVAMLFGLVMAASHEPSVASPHAA
ncbi:MAG: O-antigen ligase family protein [Anaerolineae bacterium]